MDSFSENTHTLHVDAASVAVADEMVHNSKPECQSNLDRIKIQLDSTNMQLEYYRKRYTEARKHSPQTESIYQQLLPSQQRHDGLHEKILAMHNEIVQSIDVESATRDELIARISYLEEQLQEERKLRTEAETKLLQSKRPA